MRRRPGHAVGPATTLAVVAAVVGSVVLVTVPASPAAGATAGTEPSLAESAAHDLLTRARRATAAPHSGRVTVVSFTEAGPRVAALGVAVLGRGAELRAPERVLVGPGGAAARTGSASAEHRVPTSALGLDVDAVLARWDAAVGTPVVLDTGPATPVHLVRRGGTAVRETLYVDERTGIPVRRETRAPDGRVLRVVAYTELDAPAREPGVPTDTGRLLAARTDVVEDLVEARAAGFEVPQVLGAGFGLVTVDVVPSSDGPVEGEDAMVVARYSDGLSVLSVYQQHGVLDPGALEGAVVHHVAGRDVWTWPGREPARHVWTGDGRTWTAVTDAPPAVVEEALGSLPGELVGHDAPHRLRRGLERVWRFVTAPLR